MTTPPATVQSQPTAFSVLDPCFGSAQAARVAGCELMTLFSWRRRFNLLGGTTRGSKRRDGYRGKGDATGYTLLDLCVVRLVVTLAESGIETRRAVFFTGGLDAPPEVDVLIRGSFNALICGNRSFRFIGFLTPRKGAHFGDGFVQLKMDETVEHLLARTGGAGILFVVDMLPIVEHVLGALGIAHRGEWGEIK